MTREQLEAAVVTSPRPGTRGMQLRRADRIEDYLFIHGDRLLNRQAASRLGVSMRTITRYRRTLREAS